LRLDRPLLGYERAAVQGFAPALFVGQDDGLVRRSVGNAMAVPVVASVIAREMRALIGACSANWLRERFGQVVSGQACSSGQGTIGETQAHNTVVTNSTEPLPDDDPANDPATPAGCQHGPVHCCRCALNTLRRTASLTCCQFYSCGHDLPIALSWSFPLTDSTHACLRICMSCQAVVSHLQSSCSGAHA